MILESHYLLRGGVINYSEDLINFSETRFIGTTLSFAIHFILHVSLL